MKLTKAQQDVFAAMALSLVQDDYCEGWTTQGFMSKYMPNKRLPHPSTLDALVKMGVVEKSDKGYRPA